MAWPADVPAHGGLPRDARSGSPGSLLVPARLQQGRGPARCVLDLDETDGAELAGTDHLPGLPHHRIAGVIVRDGEHETGASREAQEIEGVVEPGGERLVADDVDAT